MRLVRGEGWVISGSEAKVVEMQVGRRSRLDEDGDRMGKKGKVALFWTAMVLFG